MVVAVLQFPGSNRDRDMILALTVVSGQAPALVWHQESELPGQTDLIVLPGGFSYGDYLRSGAIAARSPIMNAVRQSAEAGVPVLGVCNGFQILIEAGLLPGALMRNASQHFVCRQTRLEVANTTSLFTQGYKQGQELTCTIAHGEGNYFADPETIEALEKDDRVVFRYSNPDNPNGSVNRIAGILNDKRNVLGMMPHPENNVLPYHPSQDGKILFESVLNRVLA
jgi:phosphoribosylformylglycinamidine synthase I